MQRRLISSSVKDTRKCSKKSEYLITNIKKSLFSIAHVPALSGDLGFLFLKFPDNKTRDILVIQYKHLRLSGHW